MLKVPESKVRVVAGDIGGSFGMKSAVYNEVALVLLASKIIGRPVKWTSTRSEAFLSDAQARDHVTEAELALDKDGKFLGFRVTTIANVGAYLQRGGSERRRSQSRHPGRRLPHAGHPCGRDGGVHQHAPDAALSRQRPARGGLCHRAHDRPRGRRNSASIRSNLRRRNIIPPEAMPFKTGADLHLRLRRVREEHGSGARHGRLCRLRGAPGRSAAARQAARHRPLQLDRAAAAAGFEGAEIRFDRAGTRDRVRRARSRHGQGHETIFKQLVCDRLGVASRRTSPTCRATPTWCSSAKARAARARPPSAARRSCWRPTRSSTRRSTIAAHLLERRAGHRHLRATACSRRRRRNRTLTMKEVAQGGRQSGRVARTTWSRASSPTAVYHSPSRRISRTAAMSANSRSTRRPARSRSCATASSTMSAR